MVAGGRAPGDPYGGAGGAQLALDGREELPTSGASTPPGGVDPSLGTLRDQTGGDRPPERPTAGAPGQLPLFRMLPEAWDALEPLSRWGRRRVAAGLADRQGVSSASDEPQDNLAKCCNGVARPGGDGSVTLYRTDRGKCEWTGMVRCKDRCCPECGPRWARKTCNVVGAVVERWLAGDSTGLTDPDAWMATIAPPHGPDEPLASTVRDLFDIGARFQRSKAWRRFSLATGLARLDEKGRYRKLAAGVPFLDATFGGRNGAHPHLHVLLLPSAARATGEQRRRAALLASAGRRPDADQVAALEAWKARADRIEEDRAKALDPARLWVDAPLRALDRHERAIYLERLADDAGLWSALAEIIQKVKPLELPRFGRKPAPQPCHVSRAAFRLTPGEDASRYFTGWGLESELGASPMKGRSHLRLLDAAAAGVPYAGAEWRRWREAVKGRQWAPGLGSLRRRMKLTDDDVRAYAKRKQAERDEARGAAGAERVTAALVTVPAYLVDAARLAGLETIELLVGAVADAGGDPQAAALDVCWRYQAAANVARLARERPPPAPS